MFFITLVVESLGEEVEPHVRELIPEGEVIRFRSEQQSDLSLGFALPRQVGQNLIIHPQRHWSVASPCT